MVSGLLAGTAFTFLFLYPFGKAHDTFIGTGIALPFHLHLYKAVSLAPILDSLPISLPSWGLWLLSYSHLIIAVAVVSAVTVYFLTRKKTPVAPSLVDDHEETLKHEGVAMPPINHVTPIHQTLPPEATVTIREAHLAGILPDMIAPTTRVSTIQDLPGSRDPGHKNVS